MASVPGVDRAERARRRRGGRLSPSSLKADCVTPRLAAALARGGTRSVTVAPEAGSERMRRVINKNLSEADILRAADLLVGEGVQDLKLYFMIGLPTETDDGRATPSPRSPSASAPASPTARAIAAASARVTVSLNPFVPKPWTPFQWDPMEPIRRPARQGAAPATRARPRPQRAARRRIAARGVSADAPVARRPPRRALHRRRARRRRRLVARHPRLAARRPRRPAASGCLRPPRRTARAKPLPWDFIDHRIAKGYLWVERRKALAARQTAPCDTATCHSCAAC